MFNEPPPTSAHISAPTWKEEPASRVYRQGNKNLCRYQRTWEMQESVTAGALERHADLKSCLELLEASHVTDSAVDTVLFSFLRAGRKGGCYQDSDSEWDRVGQR